MIIFGQEEPSRVSKVELACVISLVVHRKRIPNWVDLFIMEDFYHLIICKCIADVVQS